MKKITLLLMALMLVFTSFSQQTQIAPRGISEDGANQVTPMKPSTGQGQITINHQPNVMSTWVLPSTSSTSGNSRIPRNAGVYFERCEYLILPSEMAASGYPSANTIDAIGFLISTAGVGTQTGTLNIYLKNTSDVTYTLGSTWTTTGFTQVCNNPAFTVPIALGAYTIPFVGGSTFTYTGGGVYVAWEFSNPTLVGGTTALVAYCNTNQATMCYGYQSATVQGTALTVTAYRPATTFVNNTLTDIIAVTNIYTDERVPTPFGTPTPVGVRVSNVSGSAQTFNLTLTVKDVATSTTRYTETQPVTALAGGASTTINFTGWTPTIQEDVTINAATSAITGETFVANNTLTIPGNVNNNLYSINYNLANPGGYGFTTPGTGIFAVKYTMNGTGLVKGANVMIDNYASNPGNTVYAVLLNSAGTILAQSPNYTLLAGDMGTNLNFTFPTPQSITNSDFYIGLAQTIGTGQWYPLGIYPENPTRDNACYTFALTGGTGAADAANYKYGIEAVLVAPPTVVTNAATSIAGTTATLNGTVNANGTSSTVTYQYGLTMAYGTTVPGVPSPVTGSTATATTAALTGLATNTLYHFRIVASNIGGTTNGADMTFTTATLPAVVTTAATGVTGTTASINGTVNANNYSTTTSFDYGLTVAYGTNVPGVPLTVTGTTVTNVSAALTGLLPGTMYHYRINGINIAGPVNGGDLTFTTPAIPPTVVTTAATGVTTTIATLNGTVTANGASTTTSFDWGLTVAYGSTATASPTPVTGNTATNISANLTGLTLNTTYHYRAKGVNSAGTTYGTDMTFITVCPVAGPAGPITGPAQVCQGGTGYVYSATSPNATGYVWTLPIGASITNGANTGTITVSYAYNAAAGNLFVYGTAPCGNGAMSQLAISVNAPATPSITGPATACVNSTGNVYTTQAGMSSYVWTVPAGGTIASGQGTSAVTVTWTSAGARTVNVNYNNAGGCAGITPASYNVTVNPLPVPIITGPTPACTNFPSVYSTDAGMTGYSWTVSAGGTINSGQGTNAITVTWNATGSQTVSVNYTNANGCTAAVPVVYNVTVNAGATPTITGLTSTCVNSGYVTYTTQAGMTGGYIWAISPGGVIAFGGGTNSVLVTWTTGGPQWISVTYFNANGCAPPNPTVLNVLVTPTPGDAGTITGQVNVCAGSSGIAYSVGTIANASSYVWTLPTGATIASGAGSNSITVNYATNATPGNITVYGNNVCGNGSTSPPLTIALSPVPAPAGTIEGISAICVPATGVGFSVADITGATGYSWVVPAGATIVTGANTSNITVDFSASAVAGAITVAGTNTCGNGTVSPNFNVTVNPVPPTPIISYDGITLTSNAATGNQWYQDGNPIVGATDPTYVPTVYGEYWVVVTVNGCSSESNHIGIFLGIEEQRNSGFSLYPIPNDGKFTVSILSPSQETYSISVFNNLGMKIYEAQDIIVNGTLTKVIDVRPAAQGIYSVVLQNGKSHVEKKILIQQ